MEVFEKGNSYSRGGERRGKEKGVNSRMGQSQRVEIDDEALGRKACYGV